ncbi:HIT family protein [Brevibacterium album]|uniref:HIT family protein n=1 Tax=Brevibacterium album TaxID=417948 RepID=UPI00048EFEAA|nr:HIT family protein [Brevibacterium album]
MATIFTKIIEGEIPGEFVYEDERCAAFLDVQPMTAGHTLVVPREETPHWVDLDDELAAHLFAVAKRIGRAQERAFDCEKVGLMVQGYEVPHVHIHVWPTTSLKDFDPAQRGGQADPDELRAAGERLRAALAEG